MSCCHPLLCFLSQGGEGALIPTPDKPKESSPPGRRIKEEGEKRATNDLTSIVPIPDHK